jgi:hypothetical protein
MGPPESVFFVADWGLTVPPNNSNPSPHPLAALIAAGEYYTLLILTTVTEKQE